MGFVKVAKTSEIADQSGKAVEVGGKMLAVFNLGGTFYAIEDECNHAGGPLSEGYLDGDEVECPWHGARFNVKIGEACGAPADGDLTGYKVRIVGDDVEIEV